jgi:hypothetical protein
VVEAAYLAASRPVHPIARAAKMQMLCLRSIPSIDADTLADCEAKEALFRDRNGFLLYLSKARPSAGFEERVVRLGTREALLWLNEDLEDQGSFWVGDGSDA